MKKYLLSVFLKNKHVLYRVKKILKAIYSNIYWPCSKILTVYWVFWVLRGSQCGGCYCFGGRDVWGSHFDAELVSVVTCCHRDRGLLGSDTTPCPHTGDEYKRHMVRRLNSTWYIDGIWWQRSVSTLDPVMACCLMAPSHYLNQCWLIISEVL